MEVGSLLPATSVPPMHVTTPVVEAPLVIEYVAPAPCVTYRGPTPVDEVAFTTSASAVEYVAPAPGVHVAMHLAPTQSHVAVAEFVEYLHSQDRETPAKRFGRAGCRRAPQRRGGRTEAEGSPKRQTLEKRRPHRSRRKPKKANVREEEAAPKPKEAQKGKR